MKLTNLNIKLINLNNMERDNKKGWREIEWEGGRGRERERLRERAETKIERRMIVKNQDRGDKEE
jgi:hypothetical protein